MAPETENKSTNSRGRCVCAEADKQMDGQIHGIKRVNRDERGVDTRLAKNPFGCQSRGVCQGG